MYIVQVLLTKSLSTPPFEFDDWCIGEEFVFLDWFYYHQIRPQINITLGDQHAVKVCYYKIDETKKTEYLENITPPVPTSTKEVISLYLLQYCMM